MNRLQKKCFIASTGVHLSLAVMLIVGPAFLPSRDNSRVVTPIDFVPAKIVEDKITGGGNPNANPPPPAPPAPEPPAPVAPAVQPVKTEQPKETPKPEVKVEKAEPVRASKPVKSLPQVSTILVTSKPSKPSNKVSSKASSNSKDADKKRAAEIGRAIAGLRNNLAPTTSIDLKGPGGGGETYAGVEQAILSIYDRVWISPEGMDTSEAVVEVSVTIESDGTVSSSRITKPSGDARVDRSVQQALDRVSSIPGWDGKRRTVEFSFKSRAKEMI